MKRNICFFVILCIAAFSSALAQERSVEAAKQLVYSFLRDTISGSPMGNGAPAAYLQQMQVARIERDTLTYLYAVNMPDSGWAIVSNELRYPEIIGYSMNSYFDTDTTEQPEALRLLLEHHMNMIDSLRDSPSTFYERVSNPSPLSHPAIDLNCEMDSFLLKRNNYENQWDQDGNNDWHPNCGKVYNKFCPTFYNVSCGRTIVGCTAVAIAQIAWYWKWPDYAVIKDHIDMAGTPYGTSRRHYYDWNNMPPSLTNTTPQYQVDMVAGLLRDCGYAAHMLYTGYGSAAGTVKLRNALEGTYHFHTHRIYEYAWTNITPALITEIDKKRPTVCQAWKSISNAHTFVIDGYCSATNKFHINFGWGGMQNAMWDLGFYGYNANRTFFTQLYPNCSAREDDVNGINVDSIKIDKAITLYSQNDVTIGGLVVDSGGHLNISVGGTVTLSGNFKANLGSSVKLAADLNCESAESSAPVNIIAHQVNCVETQSNEAQLEIATNPLLGEIIIRYKEPIKEIKIYDLNGRLIVQTKQTKIYHITSMRGIYILMAETMDGKIIQVKLLWL